MAGNIRNFVIIAHIDAGKSTLADRFLELTGAVEKRQMKEQFLDQMELEREKGITIKLQPIRLKFKIPNPKSQIPNEFQIQNSNNENSFELRASNFEFTDSEYILNLIDTPGHVDFSYEVSRSLAAVEGAILLVDATKGIQAQTLANLKLAQNQNLVIIPAINKIDLLSARIEQTKKEIIDLLKIKEEEIFLISAKTGENVENVLQSVIEKIPSPKCSQESVLRALIFDSRYDTFQGVIAYVRIVEGKVKAGDNIYLKAAGKQAVVKEVGYFTPKEAPTEKLMAGEIGYIVTGVKHADVVQIGDTITHAAHSSIKALPGYTSPKPVVFVSFYPQEQDDFDALKEAVTKLRLNDPSFAYEFESHEALGRGFRCGFLGVLHSEIISERIRREFNIPLVISRPSVEFRVTTKGGEGVSVKTASEWLDETTIQEVKEPWVWLEVITPQAYFSQALQLLQSLEGRQLETNQIGEETIIFRYEVPLREIIIDFYDKLKSATSGMASMDYYVSEFRQADLVKLEILVAGQKEEAFSRIVPRHKAQKEGRVMVEKLKQLLSQQQFAVSLQAAVGGTIIARETIKARRRDVTAPLYGGDITRKRKVLERQKKGKKELASRGKVHIPSKVFLDVFRS